MKCDLFFSLVWKALCGCVCVGSEFTSDFSSNNQLDDCPCVWAEHIWPSLPSDPLWTKKQFLIAYSHPAGPFCWPGRMDVFHPQPSRSSEVKLGEIPREAVVKEAWFLLSLLYCWRFSLLGSQLCAICSSRGHNRILYLLSVYFVIWLEEALQMS